MSPTCTMVLLKLHCEVMEATLSALVAMVSGGRDGASPTRSTGAPTGQKTVRCNITACSFFCPPDGANTTLRSVTQTLIKEKVSCSATSLTYITSQ